MDPRQLYERQVVTPGSLARGEKLGRREQALLDWIVASDAEAFNMPDARVAELSIGDGQLSRGLATAFPSMQIDCVDISPTRLEHARRLAADTSADLAERLHFLELNLDTDFSQLP